MSTTTTNYSFVKPALTDAPPDITVMNPNWDKVDTELKKSNDHIANKSNPHSVTKSQVGLGNVDNTADSAKPVSTAQATAIADAKKAGTDAQANLDTHTANKSNPHGVTKSQVGLGSVPNVSTNNQTPTYTQASSLTNLTSGEKLSVSMGKIMKAITDLISHIANKANPHGVTAAQSGAVDKTGDVMSGSLTVIDNFNVNKTFDDVEYKTYVRPINYSVGNNGDYSTGLIHYKGSTSDSQLMFNKDGVMLRDNVNSKAYKLFGEHNTSLLKNTCLPLDGSAGMTGQIKLKGTYGLIEAYGSDSTTSNVGMRACKTSGDSQNSSVIMLWPNNNLDAQLLFRTYVGNVATNYKIFGKHNKTSGYYTGNGSATERSIDVGSSDTSDTIMIRSDYDGGSVVFVTPHGSIGKHRATVVAGSYTPIKFTGGKIVIASADAMYNQNGTKYYYQVL